MSATLNSSSSLGESSSSSQREPRNSTAEAAPTTTTKCDTTPAVAVAHPFHVLMIPPDAASAGKDKQLPQQFVPDILDPKFERDYISKRYRAFQQAGVVKVQQPQSSSSSTMSTINDTTGTGLWKGVSNLERSLVYCCERVSDEEGPSAATGALDKDKVLRFLRLTVLFGCCDFPSRVLALAILERSLDEDELDHQERIKSEQEALAPYGSNEKRRRRARKRRRMESTNDQEEVEGDDEEDEEEEETDSTEEEDSSSDDPVSTEETEPEMTKGRVKDFVAAGGLKVLSAWLVDASTPVVLQPPSTTATPKSSIASSGSRSSQRSNNNNTSPAAAAASSSGTLTSKTAATLRPSPTGFLLLDLLRFLIRIPFDRELVTSSRINKPIRNISKLVDSILDEEDIDDDENDPDYTTSFTPDSAPSSSSSTLSKRAKTHDFLKQLPIYEIKEALDELKSLWATKFKLAAAAAAASAATTTKVENTTMAAMVAMSSNNQVHHDPFASLKQKMKDRLESLTAFQKGTVKLEETITPPHWMTKVVEAKRIKEEKRNNKKSSSSTTNNNDNSNNEQLERRERENEREFWMHQDLREAQEERRRLLEQMRELQQKRENKNLDEQGNNSAKKKLAKNVRWKDGFGPNLSGRNREVLEEVFLLSNDNTSNKVKVESTNGNDDDDNNSNKNNANSCSSSESDIGTETTTTTAATTTTTSGVNDETTESVTFAAVAADNEEDLFGGGGDDYDDGAPDATAL